MRKLLIPASFAAAVLIAAPAWAMSDTQFLDHAIKVDNSEIMLGRLASQKGGTAEVKKVGAIIESDHSQNKMKADKLAKSQGVTPPTGPSEQAAQEDSKLKNMQGAAFDQEFAKFMVQGHEKAIAQFKTEADLGSGPVASFAKETLPVLEKHLRLSEDIEQGRPIASAK